MSQNCPSRCEQCQCVETGRRGFIAGVFAAAAGVVLWPQRALAKKLAIRLEKVPPLKRLGGSITLRIKGKHVLLFRESEDSIRATAATCSHKRRALAYDAKRRRIICPEHGSLFSADGKVLKGPATKPIAAFWSRLDKAKGRVLLKL